MDRKGLKLSLKNVSLHFSLIMYIIIWEYLTLAEKQSEFEETYFADGAWAELFKKSTGYLGTELMRDNANPRRYLTLDRWESKEDYDAFISAHEKEYKILDQQCEGLTENESLIGKWETI